MNAQFFSSAPAGKEYWKQFEKYLRQILENYFRQILAPHVSTLKIVSGVRRRYLGPETAYSHEMRDLPDSNRKSRAGGTRRGSKQKINPVGRDEVSYGDKGEEQSKGGSQ